MALDCLIQSMLIYVKEKRQLLVTAFVDVQARGSYVSVFHLDDACNATEEKKHFEEDHKLRVNKKRFAFDFTAKYKRIAKKPEYCCRS